MPSTTNCISLSCTTLAHLCSSTHEDVRDIHKSGLSARKSHFFMPLSESLISLAIFGTISHKVSGEDESECGRVDLISASMYNFWESH